MNDYERKQLERKKRYEARADKARNNSNRLAHESTTMADSIPLGQPIHVGHHSESADRNFRAKMGNKMSKAVEEQQKADYWEGRAASVGKSGISSDDPKAIEKLQEKLAKAEEMQTLMKKGNAALRKHAGDTDAQRAALIAIGFSEATTDEVIKPDHMGQQGFARFQLSNNLANIKRIKKRIAELEERNARPLVEVAKDGYFYCEDPEENRVKLIFEGKPDADVRAVLKKHGFNWSPTMGAWVRKLNNASIYAAKCVMKKLDSQ